MTLNESKIKQSKHKTMKTRKQFNIERVRQFCKLVNEGHTPSEAIYKMNSSRGYCRPLFEAGFYWKENGTYKAVERIHTDRYLLFTEKKDQYNELKKLGKTKLPKQTNLFCQAKQKQTTTTTAPTMKAKERELNFIQRVVKSLFNL